MKNELKTRCCTLVQVQTQTDLLPKAIEVPLKIDVGGVIKDVSNYKGVYNITDDKFCSAVTPSYNVVNHKQYFDGFAEALDRLNLKYSMNIKRVGNKAFADIDFKDRNIKFDKLNEEFMTGIRLTNSYDKTTGLGFAPRFTRLACSNGMILTRSEMKYNIKHHSKLINELEGLIETRIASLINQNNELKGWVSTSMEDSIEWLNCCRILEKLFQQPKHIEEILKRLGISMITNSKDTKIKTKKGRIQKKKFYSYVWDDDNKKTEKINRWDLYNAITNYLTFGEHITPHVESVLHNKAEKILMTPLAKLPMVEAKING